MPADQSATDSKVVSFSNGEHYHWGIKCDGWHLVKSPQLSVIQEKIPPGSGETRHYHKRAEQFFFIIAGVATMELDGNIHHVRPMQGIHVPAGKWHRISNDASTDLIITVTSTPPSHGDRVEHEHNNSGRCEGAQSNSADGQ